VTFDGSPAQPATAPEGRSTTTAPAWALPPTGAGRPARRRHPWLIAVSVVWAVVLLASAAYAVRRDEPAVRQQSSVAQALPTVDRAIADVVKAAAPAGAVFEITGYREVDRPCTLTPAWDGARYERTAFLYVPAGQERALLDRIRAALPARYDARVDKSGARELTGDAGDFVAVRGNAGRAGEVRISADTGCRPLSRPVTEPQPTSATASRVPVETVLATLGAANPTWQTHRVDCRSGGSIWTVQADARPAPAALTALGDKDTVVARPDLRVYRNGIIARTHDGVLTVTATTGC